ncbi:MAG: class I SAM-dependent methyltransferase [Alphaproteobacteria bacterium]|nr:class I SAM-dependent methyltransferase [Alphaproteobacteria bacterium]
MLESADRSAAVLDFYRALPFNYRESARDHARQIRSTNQILRYPCLTPLLHRGTRLLDVGCGAGWFALTAAYHHGCEVTGIDFNEVVIARARDVAAQLGAAARFERADLFTFEGPAPYDLVTSLGVLHHTMDCQGAIARLCRVLTKPGGHVFVGLYHRHGRRPFLEHFRRMKDAGANEAAMLKEYGRLHATLGDKTHLESWFRDQVLHPHETQHTLREIVPTLEAAGMTLVSTSINGFAPFSDPAVLFEAEDCLAEVGAERLARGQYYPGFFVFLARKASADMSGPKGREAL